MALTATFELHLDGTWTDVTDHVLPPARWSRGMFDRGPMGRLARPGALTLRLKNQPSGLMLGQYSPGHAQVRVGFNHGIGVRVHLDDGTNARYVWSGYIQTITPTPGTYGRRDVICSAVDWMALFLNTNANDLVLLEDVTCDEALQDLVDLVDVAPANTDFDTGSDTYAFCFDDLGDGAVAAGSVAHDLVMSEHGYLYVRGDATDGETLVLENRFARLAASTAGAFTDADFPQDPNALAVPSSRDHVINAVEVKTISRRVDAAATTVLVQLDEPIAVTTAENIELWTDFRDPSNPNVWVGGKDIVQPVANTDYTAWDNEDGSGSDQTANVTVTVDELGSRCKITLSTTANCFVRGAGGADGMRVRGRGLYRYSPIGSQAVNQDSIDQFKRRQLSQPIVLPYIGSRVQGQSVADFTVAAWGGLTKSPERVRVHSEKGGTLLAHAINRDIGDKITVTEPVTAVSAAPCFIHGIEQELNRGGFLSTWWTLSPGDVVWSTLNAPTDLAAAGVSGTLGQIDLTWVNQMAGADIEVYRNGALVHTATSGTTSWSDTGLSNGTSYNYALKHEDSGNRSPYSVGATASTCPATPTNLAVAGVDGVTGRIDVSWTNADAGAQTQVIRDSVLVQTLGVGVTSWQNIGLTGGTEYTYELKHLKNGLTSPISGDEAAFTAPTLPTDLAADPISDTAVTLTWTNGDAAAETEIYRDGVLAQTLAATVVTWGDTGLTRCTNYTYTAKHLKNSLRSPVTAGVVARPRFWATGGTISTPGDGYRYHHFFTSDDFVIEQEGVFDDLLVVAGGGGAGASNATLVGGGGGGAGGLVHVQANNEPAGTYPVVVGAGGAGSLISDSDQGGDGTASSYRSTASVGGGGGGSLNSGGTHDGRTGGSGGGGSGHSPATAGGAGTVNQGNDGGAGAHSTTGRRPGGGGGGKVDPGSPGTLGSPDGGDGGLPASHFAVNYAAGGAGGGASDTPDAGGTDGSANTGNGGEGNNNGDGGNGGSGVVIMRYLI